MGNLYHDQVSLSVGTAVYRCTGQFVEILGASAPTQVTGFDTQELHKSLPGSALVLRWQQCSLVRQFSPRLSPRRRLSSPPSALVSPPRCCLPHCRNSGRALGDCVTRLAAQQISWRSAWKGGRAPMPAWDLRRWRSSIRPRRFLGRCGHGARLRKPVPVRARPLLAEL